MADSSTKYKTPAQATRFGYALSDPVDGRPSVEVYVALYGSFEDGPPIVGPDCMTGGEIDYLIKELKKELDSVGQAAKVALRDRQRS